MEIDIGSNIFRDTNGVLNVQGKEQISLKIGRDGQLLLTMDIYNSEGNHIAKLQSNAWAFNNKNRFEVTTIPASLKLIDKESGEIVVEVNVVDKNKIQILKGKFYTYKKSLLEITPEFWRIAGGEKISGNVFDRCSIAVNIG